MDVVPFAILATIALASGLGVVLARAAIYSALSLVVTILTLAVLFLGLGAEFLAAVQVIVYAGAIMVLFLFVITLLNPGREEGPNPLAKQTAWAIVLGLLLLGELAGLLSSGVLSGAGPMPPRAPGLGTAEAIGRAVFTDFLFPFEVASLLLLVAVVGAIVLAKRRL